MKRPDYDLFSRFLLPSNLCILDGKVYFSAKSCQLRKDRYRTALCCLEGETAVELAETGSPNFWTTDGKLFYIPKKDPKEKPTHFPKTVLCELGSDEKLELPYPVSGIAFIDTTHFFFTSPLNIYHQRILQKNLGNRQKADREIDADKDYVVLDELPFCSNGSGFINKNRTSLFLYSDGVITPLSDEFTSVGEMRLSPDKRFLVYTAVRFETERPIYNRLMYLNTSSLLVEDISFIENVEYGDVCFIPDGKLAVMVCDGKPVGLNSNPAIYLCDPIRRQHGQVSPSGMDSFCNSVGTDVSISRSVSACFEYDGGKLYALTTRDDSSYIASVSLGGDIACLNDTKGIISEFVTAEDGIYAVAYRGTAGPEIYRFSRRGEEERLSGINAVVSSSYRLDPPIPLSFRNEKGVQINGFIQKSRKRNPTRRTVLSIHGGPKTVFGPHIHCEMQLLATLGYTVIYCNPTGSDGRGNEFANLMGAIGETDANDLLRFCEVAASKSTSVNLSNMAVIGGSYGGLMVNHLIGVTDLFKAAVSQRSISNWSSFWGMSDIGEFFTLDQTHADCWNNVERLWAQSPLRNADKVKTPTLFIHSREDHRCPEDQGISMFSALVHHGVPTRICLFNGENHELSRSGKPSHRIRRLKEIVAWLDKYLD